MTGVVRVKTPNTQCGFHRYRVPKAFFQNRNTPPSVHYFVVPNAPPASPRLRFDLFDTSYGFRVTVCACAYAGNTVSARESYWKSTVAVIVAGADQWLCAFVWRMDANGNVARTPGVYDNIVYLHHHHHHHRSACTYPYSLVYDAGGYKSTNTACVYIYLCSVGQTANQPALPTPPPRKPSGNPAVSICFFFSLLGFSTDHRIRMFFPLFVFFFLETTNFFQ